MSSASSSTTSSPALSRVSSANHLPTHPSASPALSSDLFHAMDQLARPRPNLGLRITTDIPLEDSEQEKLTVVGGGENPRAPPPSPIDFPMGLGWIWERDSDRASVSSSESR